MHPSWVTEEVTVAPHPSIKNPARGVHTVLFAVLQIGGAMGFAGCGGGGEDSKAPAASRRPAPPVVVAEVKRQPVPLEVRAFGNVEPYSSIEIKSRVSG
ncbi:MAG: hypothetical protein L0312_05420, partial [Acidobacteria bacterium]|nr:hypothetical protein [Acidobacteriota bacterium]